MIEMRVTTSTGADTVLEEAVIEGFESSLRGALIRRHDAGYEDARKLWNGMIDKHPAFIARCLGVEDVVHSIDFARDNDLLLAVRGGGHNVAGNALCDGGLVIDLSPMKAVRVDPVRRTARVRPGANWGDVDKETQLHGLVTPGGEVSTTGVAGFTLGGGMGLLRRKWGLACDNLISVEIVTADGQVITASETEHPDLFWAVRGGGGNFGVVTCFEFRLHPLGPEIYGATTIYPFEEAASVLRNWRDFAHEAPDEVTSEALIWGMPPLPEVPPEMHWAPVVILVAMYAGPVDEGERALQPLQEMGTAIGDLSARQQYVAMQSDMDPLFADGQLNYWKSVFADSLNDEVLDEIVVLYASRLSPQTLFGLRHLGGAMGRVPEAATAYGNRAAQFNISIDNTWQDPARNREMISWTRAAWASLRELTNGGVYLNFAGLGEENELLARAAYGRNYHRLVDVKRRYDPTNLFRTNVNISP
ncbi:MAG TPA: FAD-binding oxidoreductase [Rubrobacteraceae bacterium]|nr:FAD-binding oxidoreductase [Rubrobacteraceae bacterium]